MSVLIVFIALIAYFLIVNASTLFDVVIFSGGTDFVNMLLVVIIGLLISILLKLNELINSKGTNTKRNSKDKL